MRSTVCYFFRFIAFCTVIGSILFTSSTFAQIRVEEQKAEQVLQQLSRAAAEIYSLRCRFTQVKSAKLLKEKVYSEGRMVYRQPDELRWEYVRPNEFIWVVQKEKISVSNSGEVRKLSTQRAKIFKQMTQMMLSAITGKFIGDTRSFAITLYQDKGIFSVYLEPKKKDLKKLFSRIVLELAPALNMATAVEMQEKDGDTTRIEFQEVQLNRAIDEKEFILE